MAEFIIVAICCLASGAVGGWLTWRWMGRADTSDAYRSGYELGMIDGQLAATRRFELAMERIGGETP